MIAANTVLGFFSVASGAAVVCVSALIGNPEEESGMPPGAFPMLLGMLLILFGGCLAYHGWRWQQAAAGGGPDSPVRHQEKTITEVWKALSSCHSVCLCGLVLLYTLSFRYVDYRVSSWLFMLAGMYVLGARKRLELLLIPIAVSGVLYLIFRHGFTVMLPVWWG